ncbi:metallophosphoesterase family protein [Melghirimyces profundicolus]|uniref:metallophosphoesterase family protein n=1 Tax=Melghirimyces profundicolus TaxID=1242148 RepID=UPI000D35B635|nr:metallophosphoesterase family protein [Melghirimyces profundicolus]
MLKKLALLYDLHGNLPACKAVWAEIRKEGIENIVIGGDLAWGPQPKEVTRWVMELASKPGVWVIRGNADREMAERHGVREGLSDWVAEVNLWCADRLSEEELRFLGNLPEKVALNVEDWGEVLFVHGSPRSDAEGIHADTPNSGIQEMVKGVTQRVLICGHTHVCLDRVVNGKRILNPGSVGLPLGTRGASWAILGPDVEWRETMVDPERTARDFLATGVPRAEEFAKHVLDMTR